VINQADDFRKVVTLGVIED